MNTNQSEHWDEIYKYLKLMDKNCILINSHLENFIPNNNLNITRESLFSVQKTTISIVNWVIYVYFSNILNKLRKGKVDKLISKCTARYENGQTQ